MTGAVSSSRAGGVSSVQLGGPGGKAGAAASTMSGVAASVAGTIAGELQLAVDPDGRRKPGTANDLYNIEDAADTLTTSLGGTTADRGRVALALHQFAHEVASLVTARPESRSLVTVQAAIASAQNGAPSVAAALRMIDETTRAIAGG
jgi:hypothetical protein